MALKDTEMQTVSILGTAVLTAALFAPVLWLTEKADTAVVEKKYEVIEASLAVKASPKQKQPQKQFKQPDPVVKPDGVSHDENKKPIEEKKPDKKPAKTDPKPDPFKDHPHPTGDEDAPVGKPVVKIGDLSGAENADSAVSKGDPYIGLVKSKIHYQPSEFAKGDSTPIGCILFESTGKIRDVKFKPTADDDLRTAAEAALKKAAQEWNQQPEELPTRLLRLTEHYLCFNFTL